MTTNDPADKERRNQGVADYESPQLQPAPTKLRADGFPCKCTCDATAGAGAGAGGASEVGRR